MARKHTRIGILVPATNSVVEPDFYRTVPDDVTVHSHRLWLENAALTDEAVDRMNTEIERGVRYLAQARMSAIAIASTFNTFYKGPDWPLEMERSLTDATGTPVLFTSPAVIMALRTLGAKRISVVTPYSQAVNQKLQVYLESFGFDVLNIEAEPAVSQAGAQEINEQTPDIILDFALKAARRDADVVFMPCTAWRATEVAPELERHLGVPVVSSALATIWRALLAAGYERPVQGHGHLLGRMPALVS